MAKIIVNRSGRRAPKQAARVSSVEREAIERYLATLSKFGPDKEMLGRIERAKRATFKTA